MFIDSVTDDSGVGEEREVTVGPGSVGVIEFDVTIKYVGSDCVLLNPEAEYETNVKVDPGSVISDGQLEFVMKGTVIPASDGKVF